MPATHEVHEVIADLHIHSNHSRDGKSSVREILRVAIAKKLDAIAITDHDTVDGSLEAIEIVEDENLKITVIPGQEVSTADGHLLVYGLRKSVDSGMSMAETIDVAKKMNGITAVAHPFQFYRHGLVRFWIAKKADAVEVFNSKYILGLCNFLAERLARLYGKARIGGSDAHVAREVGAGLTIVKGSDVLKAIKAGKTEVMGRRQKISSYPSLRR